MAPSHQHKPGLLGIMGRAVVKFRYSSLQGCFMARRLTAPALALPIILAGLAYAGAESGLYTHSVAYVVLALSVALGFEALLLVHCRQLNTADASRKQTEQALETSRKHLEAERLRLNTIIENLPIALIIAEAPTGKLVLANKKVAEILRRPVIWSKDASEYGMWRGYHLDGSAFNESDWPLTRALRENRPVIDAEMQIDRGDGTRAIISVNAAPITDQDGSIVAGVCIFHDITADKNTARDLISAKEAAEAANIAKSAFLANISHEIRTPLGVLCGFSELLLDLPEQSPEAREWCNIIAKNASKLATLIDSVLELSKADVGKVAVEALRVSIPDIMRDIQAKLTASASEKGLELTLSLAPGVPEFITNDPNRLRQILFNVVGNAIKFTAAGRVDVLVKLAETVSTQIRQVEFSVSDTGIGLTKDQHRRIFQPFLQADASMTRPFGGTGIGLALSRKLAQALGGDVVLQESTPGVGSTFVITIDAGPQLEATPSPLLAGHGMTQLDHKAPLDGIRVLLADDSEDNRSLVSLLLRRAGATVTLAMNGADASEIAFTEDFDVVLMDIQMPVLDGAAATALLRTKGFSKPIVAFTAHTTKEDRSHYIKMGFDDFLAKPIVLGELLGTVATLAGKIPSKSSPNSSDSVKDAANSPESKPVTG